MVIPPFIFVFKKKIKGRLVFDERFVQEGFGLSESPTFNYDPNIISVVCNN